MHRIDRGFGAVCLMIAMAITAGCVTVRIGGQPSDGMAQPRTTGILGAAALQDQHFLGKVQDALVNAAHNPAWMRQCIEEAGGIDAVVLIRPIPLANTAGQQYLLEGKPPCAYGARMPFYWVIARSGDQVRVLADLGAADGVGLGRSRTNGYRDVVTTGVVGAGSEVCEETWTFNGTRYDGLADTIRCRPL